MLGEEKWEGVNYSSGTLVKERVKRDKLEERREMCVEKKKKGNQKRRICFSLVI